MTMYVVAYFDYDDEEMKILGYFSEKNAAVRYCAVNSDLGVFIKEISCLDEKDLSHINVEYNHHFMFQKPYEEWKADQDSYFCTYTCTADETSCKNSIDVRDWWFGRRIDCNINLNQDDKDMAEKLAIKMMYKFLDFCNQKPSELAAKEFNETVEISAEI